MASRLVASTDTSVEDVHFRREWLSLQEIGYRATMASLSDLAAMAAEPIGLLVAATIPAAVAETIELLADGIGQAARDVGCPIVGGDLTGGDRISLTMTVLGSATAPVGRGGAKVGDSLWVTGTPWAGRVPRFARCRPASLPSAEHWPRFAHPVARLAEARWLAEQGASAMIDISDGLSSDARHIAAASGVALEIDVSSIPCVPDVTAASRGRAVGKSMSCWLPCLTSSTRPRSIGSFSIAADAHREGGRGTWSGGHVHRGRGSR